MKTRLIIDENTVYEVDEECLNKCQSEGRTSGREYNERAGKSNNKNSMENINNYNNRLFNNR